MRLQHEAEARADAGPKPGSISYALTNNIGSSAPRRPMKEKKYGNRSLSARPGIEYQLRMAVLLEEDLERCLEQNERGK